MQFAWKLGVVALIALVLVVLPGGGNALDVVLALLSVVFLAAIALLGYRLYSQYRLDIDTLEPNTRLALYGSIGLAILTVVATDRLFDVGGAGIVAWFALLALCSYGIYWVWVRYRSYS
jgi:drug/metabolite transporter (DMT)-like permease